MSGRFLGLWLSVAIFGVPAWAGELFPPGPPASTMHSLEDIYNLLQNGAGGGDAGGVLIFPHFIESNGTITSSTNSFDTVLYFIDARSYRSGSFKSAEESQEKADPITLYVYLYDNNGFPLQSATAQAVAAPAVYTLDGTNKKLTVRLNDLFVNAGGFASSISTGYVVVSITGGTWSDVALQGMIINARTGPFDLDITALEPTRAPEGVVKLAPSAEAAKEKE